MPRPWIIIIAESNFEMVFEGKRKSRLLIFQDGFPLFQHDRVLIVSNFDAPLESVECRH